MSIDFSRPFRGTAAVAAGLVTPGALRGPRFRRLFPDVYVLAAVEPNLALRSLAASVHVAGCGVLVGYSAAELLGASCAPPGAPAEVTVPNSYRRGRPGLVVHRFRPGPGEVCRSCGALLTTPLRTAYDLARREGLTEAVVAVDALARKRFDPTALLSFAAGRSARGIGQLPRVVELADVLAESPMESRIRLAIVQHGLPRPVLQYPVGPYRLDLAYPELKLAVEYDGREHLTPERARRDLRREADLTRMGWTVLRIPARMVHHPTELAVLIHRELFKRGVRRPSVSAAW